MTNLIEIKNSLNGLLNNLKDLQRNERMINNEQRIQLYARFQLLRIEIESEKTSNENENLVQDLMIKIDGASSKLEIQPVNRKWQFWDPVETIIRALGVLLAFTLIGVFGSLPLLGLLAFDRIFVKDPYKFQSVKAKKLIANFFLKLSGIAITVEGMTNASFNDQCTILVFSHASNLDGFFVSGISRFYLLLLLLQSVIC